MWAERRRVGTRVPLNQIQSSYEAELIDRITGKTKGQERRNLYR